MESKPCDILPEDRGAGVICWKMGAAEASILCTVIADGQELVYVGNHGRVISLPLYHKVKGKFPE